MADYTQPLAPWKVTVHMTRQPPGGDWVRHGFSAVIPAVDEEHAIKGAVEFGHAIGASSDWQWKFANVEPVVEAKPAPEEALT